MNTQPWNFTVITGEPLDRIRAGNTERNLAGIPHSREFRIGQPFAGQHRDRQVGVAKQLFAAMDIAREDQAKRQDWVLRGFRQFDAPVCVIITYDAVLADSDDTAFDCGAVTTALVNAAWSRGLGAVINSQGIMQSPVVREHANIADDQVIMKAVALGWPDDSFPANAVVSDENPSRKRPLSWALIPSSCSGRDQHSAAKKPANSKAGSELRFSPSPRTVAGSIPYSDPPTKL